MIIDFHTHIFPDQIAGKVMENIERGLGYKPVALGTRAGLRQHMADHGVDLAVVLGVAITAEHVASTNTWLAELGEPALIPFATIHPECPDPAAEVARIKQAGFRGIKLHPLLQRYSPDDPRLFPAYAEMGEDLVVVIHAGGGDAARGNTSTPGALAKVFKAFPRLRAVVAHFGGLGLSGAGILSEVEEHLVPLQNVAFETSHPPGLRELGPEFFARIVSRLGASRVVFGTDYPLVSQGEDIEFILRSPLKASEKERVLGQNAQELLVGG